jgi:hypothetical protein
MGIVNANIVKIKALTGVISSLIPVATINTGGLYLFFNHGIKKKNSMRQLFFLLLIFSGLQLAAQTDNRIIRERFIAEGAIPTVPYLNVVSFMITTHSSSGSEVKIYHEGKIRGQALTPYWCELIRTLPTGSFIIFSDIVVVDKGIQTKMPNVKYTMVRI